MPYTSGTPYGVNGSASYGVKRLYDFQLRRNADNLHRQGLVLPDTDLSAVAPTRINLRRHFARDGCRRRAGKFRASCGVVREFFKRRSSLQP